jgi:hypothetical protein
MMNAIEFLYHVSNLDTSSKSIVLEFKIINHSEKDIYFSRRNTPFDSYISNCFNVVFNNDILIKFDGLFVKRSTESEADILLLKAGMTMETSVKISESYSFSMIGNYKINYNSSYFRFSLGAQTLLDYKSYSCNFFVIVNSPYLLTLPLKFDSIPTIGDKFRRDEKMESTGIRFTNTTKSQEEIILKLTKNIIDLNKPFVLTNNKLFEMWFGNYNVSNFELVDRNFIFIFSEISKENINYTISDFDTDFFAETTFHGDTITLFPKFWYKAKDSGFDTKLGILIHEFSHISCETTDLSGSVDDSLNLAKNSPEEAINAANNYEYYIEDLLW